MMSLTPEQKQIGADNYYEALGVSRRDFLKGVALAGVTSGAGLGAMYFGYGDRVADPVRIGVIGTGDEGGVLIGSLNPNYVDVKAICDIRPFSVHRAFHGDWSTENTVVNRPGLMSVYGWKTEDEARQHVAVHKDYEELLKNPDIEAVIIALPLHLHAQVAIAAMMAGKHVLTEKLMAYDIGSCKEMARVARAQGKLLATGHQRHYSVLYDNAVHLIRWGLLGQLHHIRAQWHRGNLPGRDSWKQNLPGGEQTADGKLRDPIKDQLKKLQDKVNSPNVSPSELATLEKQLAQWIAWDADRELNAEDYGYQTKTLEDGRKRSAMEELCRWRLWDRTGGGLMAELGSHQLDAASIFISSLRQDGKKAHPLSVHAVGGRHIFPLDRDCFDHVYCMFEFPGPAYEPRQSPDFYGFSDPYTGYDATKGIPQYADDSNKRIVVTYSSINGNDFGGYGEVVLGTKGTLVLEREAEVMLYKDSDTSSRVSVKDDKGGPTMDTSYSGDSAGGIAKAADTGPVSRGYTEEIEHWAWCIRNPAPENHPRCMPEVAMGDAIIALTCNVAMRNAAKGEGGYIRFREEWFDVDNDATPDGSTPRQV
jgi:predicted dehydrogenase